MNYYNYDGFGVYTDTTEEPGMLCTEAAPPTAPAGQVAVFNGEAWVLMTDIRGDWYTGNHEKVFVEDPSIVPTADICPLECTDNAFVAFYIAKKRPEKNIRVWDKVVSAIDGSPFSHAELVFPQKSGNFICLSSSIRDNGVRVKIMALDPSIWVLMPVKVDRAYCFSWMRRHDNCGYSKQGLIRTKLHWWPDFSDAYFCSEVVSELLGIDQPATYGPRRLWMHLLSLGAQQITSTEALKTIEVTT